ncbi:ASCH domain-containing protein [Methanococcus maripaludis]|uniref:Putative transcriptional regulator n=1 Tax=Methanococcus maripaludis TaxID=39152 RepID=A0A7J9PL91_METMI|nr:ASCH domain-containing protein [Methanococcus maripaludis]MBA2863982.1 putative transcriptional regulator [Methanococcus maripaludis]
MRIPDQILLSIKPIFAERIKEGKKTVEIRRMFHADPGDSIFIYESKPVQRITARFKVEKVIHYLPDKLWDLTKDVNGLSKEEFDSYCTKPGMYVAVYIKDLEVFETPINPYKLENFRPPQNYKKFDTELLYV